MREFLEKHGACREGAKFALEHGTLESTWTALCNGEGKHPWLLWLAQRSLSHRQRVIFAVRCVRETAITNGRTVYDLLTDERSRNAISVIDRWLNGEATLEEVKDAAAAAYAAYAADAAADAAAATRLELRPSVGKVRAPSRGNAALAAS